VQGGFFKEKATPLLGFCKEQNRKRCIPHEFYCMDAQEGKKNGTSLAEQDDFGPAWQPLFGIVDAAESCANATPGGSERE
jgi:hypothetical protein